ncbi:hypothetical protein [Candidatus Nitronereus thalassa]|uniref:Uncharacterized protein n=1 Tax=Candidatus Nitronereus thalassa TaxID=3020898 RepID=A0ABU3K2W8_9BACT|nr:hypothetical protein [Candidatus Nitronereus thalassa]MDT7040726.1 hypothetical protein [Candidatus Nitronereus thalassa]
MTYNISFFIPTLITTTVLMNTSAVLAHEWKAYSAKGFFKLTNCPKE